ncbi:MAG: Uma2 family endonuclease [Saprospiraceae bacterium]
MVAVVEQIKNKDSERRYTLEEYFKLEEKAEQKSEFHNGKLIPMAGGTFNHNTLSATICALLFMHFFDSEEEISIHNSDQKVYIEKYNKSVYTDTCAVVGKIEAYQGGNQAIQNPTLIVEVASKSTEGYDRGGKFRMYKSLPSFQEYVIVNQYMPVVEVFYKIKENKWEVTSYIGLEETVKFTTLDVELKMSDLYKKTTDLKDPQTVIDFLEEEE